MLMCFGQAQVCVSVDVHTLTTALSKPELDLRRGGGGIVQEQNLKKEKSE